MIGVVKTIAAVFYILTVWEVADLVGTMVDPDLSKGAAKLTSLAMYSLCMLAIVAGGGCNCQNEKKESKS